MPRHRHYFQWKNKALYAGVGVAGVALLALIVFLLGLYPVLYVNGKLVFAFQYDRAYELAYNYYSYLNNRSSESLGETQLHNTLARAVVEGFIDEQLVDHELHDLMTRRELSNKVKDYVTRLTEDKEMYSHLASILKVSDNSIRSYFLEDQAKYSILEGQLALEGTRNTAGWIINQRKESRVHVFLRGASWDGEGIVINE